MEHLMLSNYFEVKVKDQTGQVAMSYFTGDPYAVYLIVNSTQGLVPWVFSRELMRGGGDGDVTVLHQEDTSTITVRNDGKQETLTFDKKALEDYSRAIYRMVPEGAESLFIDWDEELAMIDPDQ